MTNGNLEKFKALVSGSNQQWLENVKWRKQNREWLKKSAAIALAVLRKLREQGMTQKDLADQLNISAQQVSKLLKGRENLTLETISKLEAVLNLDLVSVPVYVTTVTKEVEISASSMSWLGQSDFKFKSESNYSGDYAAMKKTVNKYVSEEDLTAA